MSHSIALTYEYLICRCHQIEQGGNACANAEIYETFNLLFMQLKEAEESHNDKKIKKFKKAYEKQLKRIAECIPNALKRHWQSLNLK